MAPQLGYAIVYGCILVLGLPLNAVSLWILLFRHSLKSTTIVFMVNLAVSDLLLVISLPMRVYFYATGTWPLSALACSWITMLFRDNIRSSCIFITCISVDRLLAVVYPLRARHLRTSSNAWKAAAVIWLFVLVLNVPEVMKFSRHLKNNTETNYNKTTCFQFNLLHPTIYYVESVLMFTTLTVNIVCTVLVSWTLHRHLPDSAQVNNKVNVMLIFVMNLVMFIICFLPVSVGVHVNPTSSAFSPLVCLASMNCCLDPLLYYFSLDAFWKKKEDEDTSRDKRHTTFIFS